MIKIWISSHDQIQFLSFVFGLSGIKPIRIGDLDRVAWALLSNI